MKFEGSDEIRHFVRIENGKLINRKTPWIWARVNSKGNLLWSNGQTSEIKGGICQVKKPTEKKPIIYPGCEVSIKNWVGNLAYTNDNKLTVLQASGNNEYCFEPKCTEKVNTTVSLL